MFGLNYYNPCLKITTQRIEDSKYNDEILKFKSFFKKFLPTQSQNLPANNCDSQNPSHCCKQWKNMQQMMAIKLTYRKLQLQYEQMTAARKYEITA